MPTRTAIVTGAARGIGQATARILQAQGLRVALIDRDADALAEAADALPGSLPCLCDVSQPDQVDQMAAEMTEKWGGLMFWSTTPVRRILALLRTPIKLFLNAGGGCWKPTSMFWVLTRHKLLIYLLH